MATRTRTKPYWECHIGSWNSGFSQCLRPCSSCPWTGLWGSAKTWSSLALKGLRIWFTMTVEMKQDVQGSIQYVVIPALYWAAVLKKAQLWGKPLQSVSILTLISGTGYQPQRQGCRINGSGIPTGFLQDTSPESCAKYVELGGSRGRSRKVQDSQDSLAGSHVLAGCQPWTSRRKWWLNGWVKLGLSSVVAFVYLISLSLWPSQWPIFLDSYDGLPNPFTCVLQEWPKQIDCPV